MSCAAGYSLLAHEGQGLLGRIGQIRPFSLRLPAVAAAAVAPDALGEIESHLAASRDELSGRVRGFLAWLSSARAACTPLEQAQRRLTVLRLRFNAILNQLDLFADALAQRSEHPLGVWLAGLDAVARDALAFPGTPYEAPPLVCYVDRGLGAAIRRARTRLPGGGSNPVAIVRVPRERMIGAGVASSLVHEVGHQAAALLRLVPSLRPVLHAFARTPGAALAWSLWERWSSEVLADLWSVARVGISAPLGMLAVVSLPRPFVFRLNVDDPHPTPWIRVKLSCALGDALYPHPQWRALARTWEQLYPRRSLSAQTAAALTALEQSLPALVTLLTRHRPASLRGSSLLELLADPRRAPAQLSALWQASNKDTLATLAPTLAFACLGQARADGRLTAAHEAQLIHHLLQAWAVRRPTQPVPAVAVH